MKKFKRGDVREDGKVFMWYRKNGQEYWADKNQLEIRKDVQRKARNKQTSTKEGHARLIFSGIKRRSKLLGIFCTVSIEEILKDIPDVCPVLNIPLSWSQRKGQSGNKDTSPSLDRFNPELGYVPGNVYWISGLANRIKSNFTSEQHQNVANWMKQIENQ